MFDPNYVPDIVDVVLSYNAWFAIERKPKDFVQEKEFYQKASTSLGILLKPRILLEEEIFRVSQGIRKPKDSGISADTVLFLHGGQFNDGSNSAVNLKSIGLRILVIYDSEEESDIHEEMAEILSIPNLIDHEITPEQQISAISKAKGDIRLYGELIRCSGRVLEYFAQLARLRGNPDV